MVIYMKHAAQVTNLYMQTQLNTRPYERSLFIFRVYRNTVIIMKTYDPFRENFLGFLKSVGFRHRLKKYN
jgi:hypothetical protein